MKFLAVENEIAGADWSGTDALLVTEAQHVKKLMAEGTIKEIYFNEDNCAVIILECDGLEKAEQTLSGFPLVAANLISFELTQLRPYTGFDRLK